MGDVVSLQGTFGYDGEYTRTDEETRAQLTAAQRAELQAAEDLRARRIANGACDFLDCRIPKSSQRLLDDNRVNPWLAYAEGRVKIPEHPARQRLRQRQRRRLGQVRGPGAARRQGRLRRGQGRRRGLHPQQPRLQHRGVHPRLLFEYACIGARGVFSSVGVAACAGVTGFELGFGYTWSTRGVSFMGGSCSLSNYRFIPRTRSAGAAGEVQAVTVTPGQKALVLRANGVGVAPRVRLTGPDGTVLESPVIGGMVGGFDQRTMLVADPTQGATHLYVREPMAGTWRLEQLGTDPVTGVQTADVIPPPTIDAKVVKGAGRERAIEFAYVPRGDTEITFVEEGGPSDVAEAIGIATPGPCKTPQSDAAMRCGRLSFTPAQGSSGQRKIVAQATRNGLPTDKVGVTSYEAPPRAMPGRIGRVRIVRRPTGVSIVWSQAADATKYEVAVKTSGGLGLLRTRSASCRILRVGGVTSRTKVKVQITPRDDEDRAGPEVATGVLRARKASTGKRMRGDGRCK